MDTFNVVGITTLIVLIASMPLAMYLDVRNSNKSYKKVKDEADRWLREDRKLKYVLDIQIKGEVITVDGPEPYYEIFPEIHGVHAVQYSSEELARKEAVKILSQGYFSNENVSYIPVGQIKSIVTRRKT